MAETVIKKILENIPRYAMLAMLSSDNGPAFATQVTQAMAKGIGADWKLHCVHRSQSSGQEL